MRSRSCAEQSITWNADCMSSQPRLAEPRTICTIEPTRAAAARGTRRRRRRARRPVSAQFWMNADCRPSTAGPSTCRWVSRHSFSLRGVAAPLLGDAHAAGEADASVDDADLAVQAVVGLERRLDAAACGTTRPARRPRPSRRPGPSRSAGRRARRSAAGPGRPPGPARHRLGELDGDVALPVDERHQVDGAARRRGWPRASRGRSRRRCAAP